MKNWKKTIKKNIKIPVKLEYDADLHPAYAKLIFPVFYKVIEMPEFKAKFQSVISEATQKTGDILFMNNMPPIKSIIKLIKKLK